MSPPRYPQQLREKTAVRHGVWKDGTTSEEGIVDLVRGIQEAIGEMREAPSPEGQDVGWEITIRAKAIE